MSKLNDYLEKKGVRHFMALVTVMYILGTIIFNIYLRSLGVFEFELIQLRYVFVGGVFALLTAAVLSSCFAVYRIFVPAEEVKKMSKKAEKAAQKKALKIEIIVLVLLIPWLSVYALTVFPKIPSGFGGAKAMPARLVGEKAEIQKINTLIAHETGVPRSALPLEILSVEDDLAMGANVKILDRNRDRILLILTKELYLSSTSRLAKNLIDAGESSDDIFSEADDFNAKPLLVKADRIESISFTLYEPPEILTRQDLKIAQNVFTQKKTASSPKASSKIVESFIVAQAPQAASEILHAVKQPVKKITAPSAPNPSGVGDDVGSGEMVEPSTDQSLETLLEKVIDTGFLDFRARVFKKSIDLSDREKSTGINTEARFALVKNISETLKNDFPDAWKKINTGENYLLDGQKEANFFWKISDIFRGVESAEVLIERLNSTKAHASPVQEDPVDVVVKPVPDVPEEEVAAPELILVEIRSNNSNPSFARPEDTVTVDFNSADRLTDVVVKIFGRRIDVSEVLENSWRARAGVVVGDSEGEIPFQIEYRGLVSKEEKVVTTSTNGESVVFDETAPSISEVAAIASPTLDSTPDYVFSASEVGVISYSGACASEVLEAALGENTVTFEALADGAHSECALTLTDPAGNVSFPLQVSEFTVDTTPISLTNVSIKSSNPNSSLAKVGDTISLDLKADGEIANLVVNIGTQAATLTNIGGNFWLAEVVLLEEDVEGILGFDIKFQDANAADTFVQVTSTTDESQVVFDKTAPVLAEVTGFGDVVNTQTPVYVFNSSEEGVITYSGDCAAEAVYAAVGENSLTFLTLAEGVHSGCGIFVTDGVGNISLALEFGEFVVKSVIEEWGEGEVVVPAADEAVNVEPVDQ